MTELINIEVVYGQPQRQELISLKVTSSTSIKEAIIQSDICKLFPQIELANARVGIFSRAAKLSDTLREGDRIEIYRPLLADPKEIRKRRAEQAKERASNGS